MLSCNVPVCSFVSFPGVSSSYLPFNKLREDLSLNFNGIPDLIVTLVLIVFALVSRKMEKTTVAAIDTAQQTAQDYSGRARFQKPAQFSVVRRADG